ncbi:hypothetical protein CJF42_09955 [Pseudoalteromonas sp. NBT06-2]|uniref:hypothetical protein n=1 Tax=Pseudoalteromonas sp. NBT06-2 TaxID=2025950 RepID=UPI000BA5C1A1|nr:hypothetical protein [Pseudoalteromonas sp. NBT06-2]PAJ74536.1 hypothetical protein CJF42_09955 [Pseudoalteromonas sp. NBT06-2]
MKKIFSFIITSLVIGNIISWVMGSWPIDFKRQAYNEQQFASIKSLKQELVNNAEDISLLVELGSTYSMHNDIDLADNYLAQAHNIAPNDALVMAWYNANSAKVSGASLDFTMGFYKLYTLNKVLGNISKAVDLAPNDLTIRLIRLATFANIGKINPNFDLVFNDEAWFNTLLKRAPKEIPEQVKGQFYIAMAQAYFFKADTSSAQQVQNYLNLYQAVKTKAPLDLTQYQNLEIQFSEQNRGELW